MRKPIKGTKRRSVYPYQCEGCGRWRIAFDYDRAQQKTCKACETPKVDPDQGNLFATE